MLPLLLFLFLLLQTWAVLWFFDITMVFVQSLFWVTIIGILMYPLFTAYSCIIAEGTRTEQYPCPEKANLETQTSFPELENVRVMKMSKVEETGEGETGA